MSALSESKDKFRILTQNLGDAVICYFSDIESETVFHITHSANTLIKDIYEHFQQTEGLEDIDFWTDVVDMTCDTTLFNYKRVNGKQGLYVATANALKHADKDTRDFVVVTDQMACEYLYATIRNFVWLRDSMLSAGLLNERQKLERDFSWLRFAFSTRSELAYGRALRDLTKIDYLCDKFLDWHAYVEFYVSYFYPESEHDFYAVSNGENFSRRERNRLLSAFANMSTELNFSLLLSNLKAKFRFVSLSDHAQISERNLMQKRQPMREFSKHVMQRIVSEWLVFQRRYDLGYESKKPYADLYCEVEPKGLDLIGFTKK